MKLKLTNDNLKRYHLLGTLVVVVTLALALAASFLWIGITEHREITRRFEQNQRDHLHDRLETEMDAAVGYLDFLEVRTESVLRQALREKIAMAMQTARAIHAHESKLHPEAAVKRLILDTLRPQRFFDGRGYFFAQDQQGVSILLPINPALDIGQIEGGFVQGMGWLTSEELHWRADGKLMTHAPSTYKIPTAADVPAVFNVAL